MEEFKKMIRRDILEKYVFPEHKHVEFLEPNVIDKGSITMY